MAAGAGIPQLSLATLFVALALAQVPLRDIRVEGEVGIVLYHSLAWLGSP